MHVPDSVQARLGAKLRELRTRRGLSVRTLAARTGFSPSFISQVEADLASPSLASLEKVARALGVTLGQLFSDIEATSRTVVRHDERATYASAWSRSTVEVLTDPSPNRKLSAVRITIEPGGTSGARAQLSPHDTFALLLGGALLLTTDGGTVTLTAGDAAYLAQGAPAVWENRGDEPATLLLVGVPERSEVIPGVRAEDAQDAAVPTPR